MASNSSNDRLRNIPRGGSRLYLFCLTAACSFLLAVAAFGGWLSSYEATVTVLLYSHESEFATASPEEIQRQMLSSANLLAPLAKVGLQEQADSRICVEARRNSSADVQVDIKFRDSDPKRASALVNELAQQCVRDHRRQAELSLRREFDKARTKNNRTQQEKHDLDQEIRRFLDDALPQTEDVSADSSRIDPARVRNGPLPSPIGIAGGGAILASAEMNVDAENIRRELAEREQYLKMLLDKRSMTSAHPKVQLVQLDIERLKGALLNAVTKDTPQLRHLEPEAAWDIVSPSKEVPGKTVSSGKTNLSAPNGDTTTLTPLLSPELTKAQVKAAERLRRYREEFQHLNETHLALARAEHKAWEQCRNLDDMQLAGIEPARRTLQLDFPRWQRYTALMAVLCTGLGIVMVSVAKRGDVAFITADHARRQLSVPVVGVLVQDGGRRFSWGRLAYRLHHSGRTSCEWMLGAMVLWLLMLSVLDSSFFSEIVSDPLATIALACRRTLG